MHKIEDVGDIEKTQQKRKIRYKNGNLDSLNSTVYLMNLDDGYDMNCVEKIDRDYFALNIHKSIRIWNIRENRYINESLKGHKSIIWCIKYLKKCKKLASGAGDGIKIWNLETGESEDLKDDDDKDKKRIRLNAFEELTTGELVCARSDEKIKIWDLNSKICHTINLDLESCCLKVLSNGKLAVGLKEKKVMIFNCSKGVFELDFNAHDNCVTGIQQTTSGELVTASYDATIKVWKLDNNRNPTLLKTFTNKDVKMNSMKIFSNNKLYAGGDNGEIMIWDMENKELIGTIEAHGKNQFKNLFIFTLLKINLIVIFLL